MRSNIVIEFSILAGFAATRSFNAFGASHGLGVSALQISIIIIKGKYRAVVYQPNAQPAFINPFENNPRFRTHLALRSMAFKNGGYTQQVLILEEQAPRIAQSFVAWKRVLHVKPSGFGV